MRHFRKPMSTLDARRIAFGACVYSAMCMCALMAGIVMILMGAHTAGARMVGWALIGIAMLFMAGGVFYNFLPDGPALVWVNPTPRDEA